MGKLWKQWEILSSLGSKITVDGDYSFEIKRHLLLGRKAMTKLDSILKSRDITFAKKGLSSQRYGFFSSHVWMWELDHKESWEPKNWCFWTVALKKTLESPLDCKEIQPVHPEGNQSWIFIGRTDAEAEAPILWPPDAKNWLIGKDSDAGKDWRREEKGSREWDGWTRLKNWTELKCMAMPLCCPPESTTTLLINYFKKKKKLKKKEKLADPFSSWNWKITPNIFCFINFIERVKMNTQWNHKRRVTV